MNHNLLVWVVQNKMANLKDLINVNINRDTITIQGVDFPILFDMQSFAYITESYGKPYHIFENDINNMLKNGKVKLHHKELRICHSLIYALIRSGGTHTTPEELRGAIPLNDLQNIFQKVLDVYQMQNFQKTDLNKLKNGSKKK